MPRHTLFAYVDGSDLDDIADASRIGSCAKHSWWPPTPRRWRNFCLLLTYVGRV